VRSLCSDLLGKDVAVRVETGRTTTEAIAAVAVFVTEAGALASVAACDIALGGALGAALALLPASLVQESLAAGQLRDDLYENLGEVFNIMTTLFNVEGRPRITLSRVHAATRSASLPAPVAAVLARKSGQLAFAVTVPGYGTGQLHLVTR
jgi:hypothetical protein